MARLSDAEVFVSVVDSGGFSAAARRHGVTQPAISRRIAALEARLGARLLVRSTRRFALSEAGRVYVERCRRLLAELAEAEREVAARSTSPRGVLRVAAPPLFARRVIVPRLADFFRRHPDVTLELVLAERYVDVVDEGFEVAIRLREPAAGAAMVARRIGFFRSLVCCAPVYLRGRRPPDVPADLAEHACIVHAATSTRDEWTFRDANGTQTVRVRGPLRTNDVDAIHAAARAGVGIAALPSFAVPDDLAAGTVAPLLASFTLPQVPVWAVHAGGRHRSARVRVFVDWLAKAIRRD
jgi:DNA-binding transcriptional LysR family regulator